ncbi:MAG: hypothetical protein ACLPPF_21195 [Rhodomicrobium sp.]
MPDTASENTPVIAAPISAELVAAAFQCLALIPRNERRDPALMIAIARTISRSEGEARALFTRIRAFSNLMPDPRWQPWEAYFKNCDAGERQCFAFLIRRLIAILPITRDLRFNAGAFFDALLAGSVDVERN